MSSASEHKTFEELEADHILYSTSMVEACKLATFLYAARDKRWRFHVKDAARFMGKAAEAEDGLLEMGEL